MTTKLSPLIGDYWIRSNNVLFVDDDDDDDGTTRRRAFVEMCARACAEDGIRRASARARVLDPRERLSVRTRAPRARISKRGPIVNRRGEGTREATRKRARAREGRGDDGEALAHAS